MDGYQEALRRIEENKRTRDTFLDLGNLGLTEIPEEVFDCIWLEHLNLGWWYPTWFDQLPSRSIQPSVLMNSISIIPQQLSDLKKLRGLYLSENNLSVLDNLVALDKLDYSNSNFKSDRSYHSNS